MYKKTTLPNGLRILTSSIPHARSVSVSFFMGAGSRYESKRESGVAHFVEHMFFKGTERRPVAQIISEAVEGVGGIINAEVGKEMAVYWAKVALPHMDVALDVLTDVLRHSLFEPAEIEKERRVILEELSMVMDDPREWVDVILDEVMWGDQPLGRDVGGSKESVSNLTREDLLAFLASRYSPRATVLSMAGAIEHERIVDDIARRLGDWEGDGVAAAEPATTEQSAPQLRLQPKDTEQAHICLGVRGVSYRDPDRYGLDLLNVILGEGMSSRLFLEIREKQGLAYDVHSYVNHYQDAGMLVTYAGVDPKRAEPTIEALLEQLRRLKATPPPETEVVKAREFWKGRMILRLEDTRGISSWTGAQELLLNEVLTIDDVIEIVDRLTAEDVLRAANRCFTDDRLNLSVVGPTFDEARIVERLRF